MPIVMIPAIVWTILDMIFGIVKFSLALAGYVDPFFAYSKFDLTYESSITLSIIFAIIVVGSYNSRDIHCVCLLCFDQSIIYFQHVIYTLLLWCTHFTLACLIWINAEFNMPKGAHGNKYRKINGFKHTCREHFTGSQNRPLQ